MEAKKEKLISIQDYCNLYSMDDQSSFIYSKSFSQVDPKTKEDWDLFLQTNK